MNNEAALQVLFSATFFKREGIVFFLFYSSNSLIFFRCTHFAIATHVQLFYGLLQMASTSLRVGFGLNCKYLCGDSEFESGQD